MRENTIIIESMKPKTGLQKIKALFSRLLWFTKSRTAFAAVTIASLLFCIGLWVM